MKEDKLLATSALKMILSGASGPEVGLIHDVLDHSVTQSSPIRIVKRADILDIYTRRDANGSLACFLGGESLVSRLYACDHDSLAMAIFNISDGRILSVWLSNDASEYVAAIVVGKQ